MSSDYYEVLGVARDASADDIKRAYRKKAMKLHPDVAGPGSEEAFKEVQEAYEVLQDPQKRAVFDRGGDPAHQGASGFGDAGFGGGGFDFTNLVDAMFGGGSPFGGQGGSRRGPRSRVRRGQDALVRLRLTLAEAVFGVTKPLDVDTAVVCPKCHGKGSDGDSEPVTCTTCEGAGEVITVQRSFLGDIRTTQPCPTCRGYGSVIPNPCSECSGEGRVRTSRTINVKIPAGVDDGNRIHLDSQGEVGPGGGPAGDLYVELSVAPHEVFRRDGANLEMAIEVPMTAAALGTTVSVRTLEADREDMDEDQSSVEVEIPAGTQSGARIVVEGRGIPRLRGGGRGDLGVSLLVRTPTKLDGHQKDLLREFAESRGEHEGRASVHTSGSKGVFSRLKEAFGG
ncbi:molecular chaperone DnaJ [Acidipropionibacterium jensenii]|uniref:Chaperone protein DnaJ n=1 Tax=Acidipropionibacterium jensenii TaxID=1749 RepID=A0A3T0RZZ7_9ACTN|nr:molecular chaperone DnaJ [Acidipropionibacterium jensenii]AZZ39680.1 molecular chaperone DnaJ [Acidipropionibacterium jensenii]